MARDRRPRAAPKASPAREPTTLEPSAVLRSKRAPVPSSEATRRRIDELLALVDREGYRHPFLAAASSDNPFVAAASSDKHGTASSAEWLHGVDKLLGRYRSAEDPRVAAEYLGAACRCDPRLFAESIVHDQLTVWRLEVAEGAVKRDLPARGLRDDNVRAELEEKRRKTSDVAREALRRFGRALAAPMLGTHVAADVFRREYRDVEERVQRVVMDVRSGSSPVAALKRQGLSSKSADNVRELAAPRYGLEIIARETARRLGLSRTRVLELRDSLIGDPSASAARVGSTIMTSVVAEIGARRARRA